MALALVGLWIWYEPTIEHAPGILAPDDPSQREPRDATPFEFRGYTIEPLADFRLTARVLSRETYRMDRQSDLSPVDLTLGWGAMSDSAVLAPFTFSQSGRWYLYTTPEWPIPKSEVIRQSANMHLIPSTPEIESLLDDVIVGQVVTLGGSLVKVEANDGWKWVSSMTRRDTGQASCEIVWVTELKLE